MIDDDSWLNLFAFCLAFTLSSSIASSREKIDIIDISDYWYGINWIINQDFNEVMTDQPTCMVSCYFLIFTYW